MKKLLVSENPILTAQIHPTRNPGIVLNSLSHKSDQRLWWICKENHEWRTSVKHRTNGSNCPYCSGRIVRTGENDLETLSNELAIQWSTANDRLPSQVAAQSKYAAWWICAKNHTWKSTVAARFNGNNCPFCSNKKVLEGYNDLATINPELAKQWEYIKNFPMLPTQVLAGSKKYYYWKCNLGHNWRAPISRRTQGHGCPICAGKTILEGFNDLFSLSAWLVEEWHPTKNSNITPHSITKSSGKIIWWQCAKAHEWAATPSDRTRGSNCPQCAVYSSAPEEEIYSWLCEKGFTVERNNRKILGTGQELDIYLPDRNFAIEYNGLYWHSEINGKDKNYHKKKYQACKNKNITLFTIWEDDWRDKKEIVKNMLAHRLIISTQEKVSARQCTVVIPSFQEVKSFLGKNHIQDSSNGSIRIGLLHNGIMVALGVFRNNKNIAELERYATSCLVRGGLSKILSYLRKNYTFFSVTTFADISVSEGSLYEKLGFKQSKIIEPDYSYLIKGKRVHKFNYRLNRFKSDPSLVFQEGLSESQLAKLNLINRIWDSGKIKYTLML